MLPVSCRLHAIHERGEVDSKALQRSDRCRNSPSPHRVRGCNRDEIPWLAPPGSRNLALVIRFARLGWRDEGASFAIN
jgi:hypothetical protein